MNNKSKIFLSFLGTGKYSKAFYEGFNEKNRYVQEALIKGRLKDIKFKKIIFILTQDARRTHWGSVVSSGNRSLFTYGNRAN